MTQKPFPIGEFAKRMYEDMPQLERKLDTNKLRSIVLALGMSAGKFSLMRTHRISEVEAMRTISIFNKLQKEWLYNA